MPRSRESTKSDTPQRLRAKRMPAGERSEQILDAAEVVFSGSGYRDAGTAAVAAEAGVSEPTLYRYFGSKRDLYLAMLERNAERLLTTWKRHAEESADPIAALGLIGTNYLRQLESDPSPFLLRARSLLETGDEAVARHAREYFWKTFDFIQGLYEDARTQDLIDANTDTRSQAWLFMAIGGLLDQFLLMGLEGLDPIDIGRMMAVVGPQPGANFAQATGTVATKEGTG